LFTLWYEIDSTHSTHRIRVNYNNKIEQQQKKWQIYKLIHWKKYDAISIYVGYGPDFETWCHLFLSFIYTSIIVVNLTIFF
jgi:hypothetical protein